MHISSFTFIIILSKVGLSPGNFKPSTISILFDSGISLILILLLSIFNVLKYNSVSFSIKFLYLILSSSNFSDNFGLMPKLLLHIFDLLILLISSIDNKDDKK